MLRNLLKGKNRNQEPGSMRSRIGTFVDKHQRLVADRLNCVSAGWTSGASKLFLVMICILFTGLSSMELITSFKAANCPLAPSYRGIMPKHIGQPPPVPD